IAIKPDYAEAQKHLGMVLCAAGRIEEGFAAFTRNAELVHRLKLPREDAEPAPAHRLRHDREQRGYLNEIGIPDEGKPISETFHLEEGGRIAGPAVNPRNSIAEISEDWRSQRAQM